MAGIHLYLAVKWQDLLVDGFDEVFFAAEWEIGAADVAVKDGIT